jgi:hypothetical protein
MADDAATGAPEATPQNPNSNAAAATAFNVVEGVMVFAWIMKSPYPLFGERCAPAAQART